MRVLLGGVPFGCDNIGDEAIIAGVVGMLKETLSGVELTVATNDPATAAALGVGVVPPFGFLDIGFDGFAAEVKRHDAYIWCGATGLSDYPHVALELVEIAQGEGVPTFIWGVGMDDELNPVFFRAHGRRLALLKMLGLVGAYERYLHNRLKRRIARVLPRCKGVWLRDPPSAAMLAKMGFPGAHVTADSAILLADMVDVRRETLKGSNPPMLGLCISTQRQVADLEGLKGMIAAVRNTGACVLGIPMSPKTDRALLERLGVECIPGATPKDVMSAAANCDVVLSSRLHLLILAANAGTPGLGIARGSKLANWLSNFGETVVGSVYDCDWKAVTQRVLDTFENRGDWKERRESAYQMLNTRLEKARMELAAKLKE